MRVTTLNVHGCVGIDFRQTESRVAGCLASLKPDIVALQELDMGRTRSGGSDQAGIIASHLNFESHFHPSMTWREEMYGNAILSRWPFTVRKAASLPSEHSFLFCEQRAAMWLEIHTPLGSLNIINTHFGVGRRERQEQANALMGNEWLRAMEPTKPLLLVGDFNSLPGSSPYKIIAAHLDDLVRKARGRNLKTFPTPFPLFSIDHIFGNHAIQVSGAYSPSSWRAAITSDHLPLVLDFNLPTRR